MKTAFSKVITIWLTIVLLVGAVVGINAFADANTVATVDFKNVSYDGQIQLVYYVKTDVADAADGSYVKIRFWRAGVVPANANDQLDKATDKESTLTRKISGVNYSIFFSGGILPKMMREDVYACTVRYDAQGNVINTGELFSFSVQEYVKLRLAAGSTDAQVELYMALLGYGAAVQEAFDYNTDKLAGKLYDFEGYTASEVTGATSSPITLYYDPTAKTYSIASTGAEGEISYDITFVKGGRAAWDEEAGAFTMEKKHEIVSIVGSDGSDSLVYNEVEYTAGDLVPFRSWLLNTNPGNAPAADRKFAAERPTITLLNPQTRAATGDVLYEFETDFVTTRYSRKFGSVAYIHLLNDSGATVASSLIQDYYGQLWYNAATIGGTPSGRTGVYVASGDKVSYRIVISKADADNVSVCVYINGEATTPITVPSFEFSSIKFVMQDDGDDRNATVTLMNTNFIKYVAPEEANPYEPNTDQLPNVDVDGTVTTATIWGKDGTYYKTATEGATEYKVSFKNSYSAVVNSNGSVSYFPGGEITAIKTSDGTDVPYLPYGEVNYGVGDIIPNRAFFISTDLNADRVFVIGMTMLSAAAAPVNVPKDEFDTDLLMLLETDLTVDAGHLVDGDYVALISIPDTNSAATSAADDPSMRILMSSDAGKPVTRLSSFSSINASSNTAVEVGKTFKLRIEVRENESGKYDYIVKLNGNVVSTTERDYAPTGSFTIGRLWDDQARRYNTMTFKNFKAIKYNVIEYAQPLPDEIPADTWLAQDNVSSPVSAEKTLYYNSTTGKYSATEGDVSYKITYKSGIDVIVGDDGSVTYSKVATIVSLKDANGNDTTIQYNGKTYGASGEGVINYIPWRSFFFGSTLNDTNLFGATTTMFGGSHKYGTYVAGLDDSLINLFETDMKLEAVGDAADTVILHLVMNNAGGSPAGYVQFLRDVNGNISVSAPGISRTSLGVTLDETFKFRMELWRTGEAGERKTVIFINDIKIAEGNVTTMLRGDIEFQVYDYCMARNHKVTFKNFKWLRAHESTDFGKS